MQSRALLLALLAGLGLTAPARADLQFCNKTSYVLDLALGAGGEGRGRDARLVSRRARPVQERDAGHAGGREGLRPRPRACRLRPLPAAAGRPRRLLHRGQQFHHRRRQGLQQPLRPAADALLRRSSRRETEQGLTAYLGEEADYDPAQARLAGIQRLLVIAGYDANPIDGLEGKKTAAALDQFLKDRRLPADDRERRDVLPGAARCREGSRRRRLLVVQRDAVSP